MEIVSQGGIPDTITKEEFLSGVTSPVNPDLMNIFIKCDICEESGHGVRDIVTAYGDEAFKFDENRITVTIPFNKKGTEMRKKTKEGLTEKKKKVMRLIRKNERITAAEIVSKIGFSRRTVQTIILSLKNRGMLVRIGSNKNGYWKIQDENETGIELSGEEE